MYRHPVLLHTTLTRSLCVHLPPSFTSLKSRSRRIKPGTQDNQPQPRLGQLYQVKSKPAHICRSGVAIEEPPNHQQTLRNNLNFEQAYLVFFTSAKGLSRRLSTEFTYRKICKRKRNTSLLTPTPTPGSTLLSIQAPAATLLEQALEFQSPRSRQSPADPSIPAPAEVISTVLYCTPHTPCYTHLPSSRTYRHTKFCT